MFDFLVRLLWPERAANKNSVRRVKELKQLRKIILDHGDVSSWHHGMALVDLLCDLIQGLLRCRRAFGVVWHVMIFVRVSE
jgi:hypothetical protein